MGTGHQTSVNQELFLENQTFPLRGPAGRGGRDRSSSEVVRQVDITVGQQLIDLKKARFLPGALSASEYDSQRRKII